jgi:hypothetical protein
MAQSDYGNPKIGLLGQVGLHTARLLITVAQIKYLLIRINYSYINFKTAYTHPSVIDTNDRNNRHRYG